MAPPPRTLAEAIILPLWRPWASILRKMYFGKWLHCIKDACARTECVFVNTHLLFVCSCWDTWHLRLVWHLWKECISKCGGGVFDSACQRNMAARLHGFFIKLWSSWWSISFNMQPLHADMWIDVFCASFQCICQQAHRCMCTHTNTHTHYGFMAPLSLGC